MTDVLDARRLISRYLAPTPTLSPPGLAERFGCEVALKLENMQPIGAFKLRGGINLIGRLSEDERARGVVSASTGNHAQSIAWAARMFGVPAIIYMPEVSNPNKLAATRRLGAEVVQEGADFDECRVAAEARSRRDNLRYIHSANEPLLIAGVATYALELLEAVPDLDVVFVPVGGGSGVCGTALVIKTLRPEARVVAVQAANMPAVHQAYHERRMVALEGGSTFAEGLATRVSFELTWRMMRELVDDVVLVSEEDMRQAMVTLIEDARVVAEGAGAAALAAVRNQADELRGAKVGVIVSGGNVTLDTLRRALCDEQAW
jgi:threonine dehydratase